MKGSSEGDGKQGVQALLFVFVGVHDGFVLQIHVLESTPKFHCLLVEDNGVASFG